MIRDIHKFKTDIIRIEGNKKKAELRYDIIKQRYEIIYNELEIYKLNNLNIITHSKLDQIKISQIEKLKKNKNVKKFYLI